jgi:hypothetical protein
MCEAIIDRIADQFQGSTIGPYEDLAPRTAGDRSLSPGGDAPETPVTGQRGTTTKHYVRMRRSVPLS